MFKAIKRFAALFVLTATCFAQQGGYVGGGGSVALIQKQVLSTSAASVTFSAIPQSFTNLLVVVNALNTNNGSDQLINLQFNGDGSFIYARGVTTNTNGTVAGSAVTTSNFLQVGITGSANPNAGVSEIHIPAYSSTSIGKGVTANGVACVGSTLVVFNGGGTYQSDNAITSFVLTVADGSSFTAGSTFSLYGIQ